MKVIVEEDAKELGIKIAYAVFQGPENPGYPLNWDEIVERIHSRIREKYTLEKLREDPIVKAYRKFYWRIGIDPTKTRPSSEALVRRILRGKWPRINPLVDAGNLASALYMVPIGLYDTSRFTPPARITLSRGGEVFNAIGGKDEVLPEGVPIMVDSQGIVMHLYPHRDSRDTMIRESTREMLAVAAGVPGVNVDYLVGVLEELERILGLIEWRILTSIIKEK